MEYFKVVNSKICYLDVSKLFYWWNVIFVYMEIVLFEFENVWLVDEFIENVYIYLKMLFKIEIFKVDCIIVDSGNWGFCRS